MSSERIQLMSDVFLYELMNLYLDYPGTGEFSWNTIKRELPNRYWADNYTIRFRKADFEGSLPDIIRELRSQDVNIVRKGDIYKIVNINDVIKSHALASKNHFQPIPQKIEKNKNLWLGENINKG